MKEKKENQYHLRQKKVAFSKHSKDPVAIVDGVFLAKPGDKVRVWRERSGRTSWHDCTVVNVVEKRIELWDDTLDQWCILDTSTEVQPDVRLVSAPGRP